MVKKLIIIFLVLIIIGGIGFYFLKPDNLPVDLGMINKNTSEKSMTGEPTDDEMMIETDENDLDAMKEITYQYEGELSDVTKREVRDINTGGEAVGIAKSNYDGAQYSLLATFENLPTPTSDDFYEGWIVQKDPFMFLSTGIVRKIGGVYTNIYKSRQDLTNYDFYVLTIEPNNGDPAPADHILEGTMNSL